MYVKDGEICINFTLLTLSVTPANSEIYMLVKMRKLNQSNHVAVNYPAFDVVQFY